ncbi:MAG: PH domain-containing protein [Duncaniella sp.]|nr:PH domain-containing protein [Duncaniella sp.]MDE6116523.1 PH domain-containing protein [Duncaniella sp.]MDE6859550.1 PH domain-containing protein [Duncaniella sp.]MDE7146537.1 PH domain-containing protein [Duncaniella sp.]
MKQTVKISAYSLILTLLSLGIMVAVLIYEIRMDEKWLAICWGSLVGIILLLALFYMPMSVSVDDKTLNINRSLRIKSIPLSDIASVKLCAPTMGAKRVCGSGGWFGYWGWFSERDLGKYFAYYGRSSDCFLVTLTDGRLYMLGCQNPDAMVSAIQSRLK